MRSSQIKTTQITTILLKIVQNHGRNQNQTKRIAIHSPERSSDVKVVFLSKASQNEVAPALRMLLPDDRKGSSGDEKSTMTTSAYTKNKNMRSSQIKTTQITTILLKIVQNHVRNNKSNKRDRYTLTAKIQFLKSRVLAQSYTN